MIKNYSIILVIIAVMMISAGYFVYQNMTIEDTRKQVRESLTLCQQDSDCVLVYPIGNSVSSCCWGCLTFSINKNQKERYDELFTQECKEIECPPYAPGAACFPHKAVCANNECQAIPEEI